MKHSSAQVRYLWGAALVWVAIWVGTAVVLKGGGGFADMIPILTVGTGWFIAVVPALASDKAGPDRSADPTIEPRPR
jgi:hypothetical protein